MIKTEHQESLKITVSRQCIKLGALLCPVSFLAEDQPIAMAHCGIKHYFRVIPFPQVVTGLGADPTRKCFPGFRRTPTECWAEEKVLLDYMVPPCLQNPPAKWKSWSRIMASRDQQLDISTCVHCNAPVYLRYHLMGVDGTQTLWDNWDLLDGQLELPWPILSSPVLPHADTSVDPTGCTAHGV